MVDMTSPYFNLQNKTIVITGGYGQIGATMAREFVKSGVQVVIIEPNVSAAKTTAVFADLAQCENLKVFQADVTDRPSLEYACQKVIQVFGSIDGLINNAALDSPPNSAAEENGPFEDYPVKSWEKIMDVNVKGVFLCCQVFGGVMAQAKLGSIINIASIYGSVSPDQNLYQYRRDRGEVFYKPVAYSASKSALYNLTRYLAVYWGSKGVRTNTLTFGGVFNNQDPEFLDAYSKKIPLVRGEGFDHLCGMARAEDFVGPAMFLLSEAATYVTGIDLKVDGGFLAT